MTGTYQPIARLLAAGWQLIAPHWWRHELHGDALTVEALRITDETNAAVPTVG